MEEAVVRMCAEMYVFVARMEALKIRVKAMETENWDRRQHGLSDANTSDAFFAVEQEMLQISANLVGI